MEWCICATVIAVCGAGWEEGFIFRGARDQHPAGVRRVQLYNILLFDGIAEVATCIYNWKGKSGVRIECSMEKNKGNYL